MSRDVISAAALSWKLCFIPTKYCPQKKLAKSVHALNFVKYCPQKKLAKSVHKKVPNLRTKLEISNLSHPTISWNHLSFV
jgi:hypothetical protein